MEMHSTTIVGVRKNGKVSLAGDGQVTFSEHVVFKNNAVKVRKIYNDKVLIGFAGGVADAFALSERFEEMLNKFSGNLMRSAVELAQLWRSEKLIRKLEAMMIVADAENMLMVSGGGEVIDVEGGVCAIGSGGNYALAAAKALLQNTKLSAEEIANKAIKLASEICVYTNDYITVISL